MCAVRPMSGICVFVSDCTACWTQKLVGQTLLGVPLNQCVVGRMHRAAEGSFMIQVDGDWRYDARKSIMLWSIDIIDDSNRTGSLEFVVPNTRPESFFPVTVNFNATRTLCQVRCPC